LLRVAGVRYGKWDDRVGFRGESLKHLKCPGYPVCPRHWISCCIRRGGAALPVGIDSDSEEKASKQAIRPPGYAGESVAVVHSDLADNDRMWRRHRPPNERDPYDYRYVQRREPHAAPQSHDQSLINVASGESVYFYRTPRLKR